MQKLLSAAGVCSRRTAETYITAGRVAVNGRPARLGERADPDRDRITLDGKPLGPKGERLWLMLNKPRGYVSTLSDEKGRRTAAGLVKGCGARVWPVGRLDLNSEGLLLFSNDGPGTHYLLHPSHQVEKEYHVLVTGDVEAAIPVLTGPLALDGVPLAHAVVKRLEGPLAPGRAQKGAGEGPWLLSVTIHEGKNHQVRRMCALAGLEVKRLKRVREGSVHLGALPPGRWRRLTPAEQRALLS